jgi:hypothetical protein
MEPSLSLPLFSLLMLVALQPIQAAVYRVTVDGSGTLKFDPSAMDEAMTGDTDPFTLAKKNHTTSITHEQPTLASPSVALAMDAGFDGGLSLLPSPRDPYLMVMAQFAI